MAVNSLRFPPLIELYIYSHFLTFLSFAAHTLLPAFGPIGWSLKAAAATAIRDHAYSAQSVSPSSNPGTVLNDSISS